MFRSLNRKVSSGLGSGFAAASGTAGRDWVWPTGMFAALTLARYGYKPLILERGPDVDGRQLAVQKFWQQNPRWKPPMSSLAKVAPVLFPTEN